MRKTEIAEEEAVAQHSQREAAVQMSAAAAEAARLKARAHMREALTLILTP